MMKKVILDCASDKTLEAFFYLAIKNDKRDQ